MGETKQVNESYSKNLYITCSNFVVCLLDLAFTAQPIALRVFSVLFVLKMPRSTFYFIFLNQNKIPNGRYFQIEGHQWIDTHSWNLNLAKVLIQKPYLVPVSGLVQEYKSS